MAKLYTSIPSDFTWKSFVLVMILGVFFVVVQSTWVSWLGLGGYGPEWVLILTIYVALRSDFWVAMLGAFLLGFIRDSVGGGFLGLYQVVLIVLTWIFYKFKYQFNFFNPLALVPLIFCLSLSGSLVIITPIMAVLGWPIIDVSPASLFIASAVTSSLAAPILFVFLGLLTRTKDKEK